MALREPERAAPADAGSRAAHDEEDHVAGLVSAVRRLAIHDGPGIRTVVFLKGCQLCCLWCAAPETQSPGQDVVFYPERCLACDRCRAVCPEGAIHVDAAGRRSLDRARCTLCGQCVEACYAEALTMPAVRRTVREVLAEVVRDRVFYDRSGGGVTLSGGEPLQQAEFTAALLGACKREGLHTAMETSGFQEWDAFARTLTDLDLLLYDLKAMDPEKHLRFTGVSNERILDNLRRAVSRGVATVIRVPVIPGFNDEEENFQTMGRLLAGIGPIQRVDLLPYHRFGEATYARLGRAYALDGISLMPDERLEELAGILRGQGFQVQIGG
jgi:pyruvate formate lyase activating enzyme